ncbi:hypothetical protein SNE40_002141 [Patella caerulea]|uniref:Uncharacterized protein n=1 Tax=Patella caerulea TaxID=87958 RepID=A0AAN8K5H8_PATCE
MEKWYQVFKNYYQNGYDLRKVFQKGFQERRYKKELTVLGKGAPERFSRKMVQKGIKGARERCSRKLLMVMGKGVPERFSRKMFQKGVKDAR